MAFTVTPSMLWHASACCGTRLHVVARVCMWYASACARAILLPLFYC